MDAMGTYAPPGKESASLMKRRRKLLRLETHNLEARIFPTPSKAWHDKKAQTHARMQHQFDGLTAITSQPLIPQKTKGHELVDAKEPATACKAQ